MWTTSTIVFSCSKCVLALRRWAHSWNARRDHQDRCSTWRWRSPKHRARHSCTACCDTSSERWSTVVPGGMEILGPASRTDLNDVQYGSVARALALQLRGRDGGSNGTVWPRRRPLLASRSQKHPYRRCSSHVARRTVETTPCPQQYSVDRVGDSESRDRQCQTHTSCVDTTPTCTRADALFCRAHVTVHNLQHFANVGTPYWLKVKGFCVAHFFELTSISFSMSLLNVPLVRLPPVSSSLTSPVSRTSASSITLGRSRVNPCTSAHWSGMSGCLANLTSNTGYEPNFHSHMIEEHTPINLPDSHRSFHCRDDATTISTTEDPEGFPHSGASGSTLQTGSHNVRIFRCSPLEVVARSCFGWQSYGHPGSWCKCGIQNLLFELLSVHSQKGREIEIKTLRIRWQRISRKSLFGKLTRPSEEREWLSEDWLKLRLKLRQEVGRREILTSLFKRSIKNLNLNDFRYIKQVDGQIKLREVKLACMDNWNWEIGSAKKIMQQIGKKLKNWEEFVAKKVTEQDKQELMNCLCIKRWILRLWVKWWLRFGNYKTK